MDIPLVMKLFFPARCKWPIRAAFIGDGAKWTRDETHGDLPEKILITYKYGNEATQITQITEPSSLIRS